MTSWRQSQYNARGLGGSSHHPFDDELSDSEDFSASEGFSVQALGG